MSMHNQSENVNDPFRLTAVLSMFKTLKLQEWGKFWSSSDRLSYSGAGNIIKVCLCPLYQSESYQIDIL